jgi:hypothetical protein
MRVLGLHRAQVWLQLAIGGPTESSRADERSQTGDRGLHTAQWLRASAYHLSGPWLAASGFSSGEHISTENQGAFRCVCVYSSVTTSFLSLSFLFGLCG